jgi:hypothetical protein
VAWLPPSDSSRREYAPATPITCRLREHDRVDGGAAAGASSAVIRRLGLVYYYNIVAGSVPRGRRLAPAIQVSSGRGGATVAYIDPVQVSPANYKLLLDNEGVRVVEMSLKAGSVAELRVITLRFGRTCSGPGSAAKGGWPTGPNSQRL